MNEQRIDGLRIEQVSKIYRRRGREDVIALRDIDMTVRPGELKCVYGPSGSGKSTLLLTAGGLLRPDRGTVRIGPADLYAMSSEQRSRARARHIGFVFQQFHLIPYLGVLDNVRAPMLAGEAGEEALQRAETLVERFGLAHRRSHPPAELSIGERQRTALARALLNEPDVLLADEPTGNLDDENGELVLKALREFASGGGAVMVVTHDRRLVDGEASELNNGVLK